MKTIKTYTEITVEQAGEMLRDNGWTKPVEGLAFRDYSNREWNELKLVGIDIREDTARHFTASGQGWEYCATVTELDPCRSPEGCPELEPWMAYVGTAMDLPSMKNGCLFIENCDSTWGTFNALSGPGSRMSVDVRTAWSQEHFSEHCRIRNYQEPDAFDVAWKAERVLLVKHPESLCRFYYELGQANPQPTK